MDGPRTPCGSASFRYSAGTTVRHTSEGTMSQSRIALRTRYFNNRYGTAMCSRCCAFTAPVTRTITPPALLKLRVCAGLPTTLESTVNVFTVLAPIASPSCKSSRYGRTTRTRMNRPAASVMFTVSRIFTVFTPGVAASPLT